MTQIQILNIERLNNNNYIELTYKMTLALPAIYGTGANPIVGLEKVVGAYPERFAVEVIPVTGTVITVTETISVPVSANQATIRTQLQNIYTTLRSKLDSLSLDTWDNAARESWDGATWAAENLITDKPSGDPVLGLTATGVAAAAVTLTIPAVSGKFHNISHLSITAYSTAARTGSATPILVTTTNLPGSPAFNFATAAAIGTTDQKQFEPMQPLKSLVANTATTIVCPATAGIIWRINCFYNLST